MDQRKSPAARCRRQLPRGPATNAEAWVVSCARSCAIEIAGGIDGQAVDRILAVGKAEEGVDDAFGLGLRAHRHAESDSRNCQRGETDLRQSISWHLCSPKEES